MHIPKGTTAQLELVSFEQALTAANTPNQEYDIEKWLYVPNFYSEYRYILGTRGKNPLICIGINPSTARPDDLDNTLKSVERIALGNGFDSFIMFNVYAQRATDPDAMEKHCNLSLHRENLEAFRYVLSISDKPAVWAAWGTIIEKRDYLAQCLKDMLDLGDAHGANWYCAGAVSKKGHPHHPLYLRKDEKIKPFDIKSYLNRMGELYGCNECDTCWYYDYDEEYEEYYCMMELDEDEYYRILSSKNGHCPYYRQGDDYTLARRQ